MVQGRGFQNFQKMRLREGAEGNGSLGCPRKAMSGIVLPMRAGAHLLTTSFEPLAQAREGAHSANEEQIPSLSFDFADGQL